MWTVFEDSGQISSKSYIISTPQNQTKAVQAIPVTIYLWIFSYFIFRFKFPFLSCKCRSFNKKRKSARLCVIVIDKKIPPDKPYLYLSKALGKWVAYAVQSASLSGSIGLKYKWCMLFFSLYTWRTTGSKIPISNSLSTKQRGELFILV